jgi:hypothetical protein
MAQGHRFRGLGRHVDHPFEHEPPRQIRRPIPAGDFEIQSTSLDVTNPKVASSKGDGIARELDAGYMRPAFTDKQSPYIHESHTNGKKE